MLITIPDALATAYKLHSEAKRIPLDKIVERQLARFAHVETGDRAVTLHGEALQEVDQLLGAGSTKDAQTLLAAIKAWAGITIGDIRLQFSPAQLDEIRYRAEKQGKTPEAVVEDIVAQMSLAFFNDTVPAR